MKYTEITFNITPANPTINEILTALTADMGCDSFNDDEEALKAYIPEKDFKPEVLDELIKGLYCEEKVTYEYKSIEEKNWNEEWEKNYFQPIIVDDKCIIHSTFHKDYPQCEFEINIDPKMAFGTGHHATTSQMVSALLEMDLKGKAVMDMGCGTGVLAILAAMKGAHPVKAIDIDPWSYDNTLENMRINHIDNIEVECGDATLLKSGSYDVFLANINRNILLNDMPAYEKRLKKGGQLLMSGFYLEDLELIQQKAEELGLHYDFHRVKDRWTVACFHKA